MAEATLPVTEATIATRDEVVVVVVVSGAGEVVDDTEAGASEVVGDDAGARAGAFVVIGDDDAGAGAGVDVLVVVDVSTGLGAGVDVLVVVDVSTGLGAGVDVLVVVDVSTGLGAGVVVDVTDGAGDADSAHAGLTPGMMNSRNAATAASTAEIRFRIFPSSGSRCCVQILNQTQLLIGSRA